jgi:hypothetical protein
MRSFGQTMRSSLSAIGLGMMTVAGAVAVSAITAAPAYAQKSSKEFVEAYNAATAALAAKSYASAISNADKAAPHAKTNQEKMALEGIRVQSHYATKNHAGVIKAIEASFALGGVAAETTKSYKQLLASAYAETGNSAKAVSLTKEYIDTYGGTADQLAWLAQNELRAKNYAGAINYAQKAVDSSRKAGQRPKEAWHKMIIQAHYDSKDMGAYYTALEKVVQEYPNENYWRLLIDRSTKDAKFSRSDLQLDMYRALSAANVKLKTNEQLEMAEQAMIRGSAVEAEKILDPLFKQGLVGGADDRNAERNKRMYANIQKAAKDDKAGGLAASEKDAATKPTGAQLITTGEAYMGSGDFVKAAELIQKGLAKGQINESEAALAKLRLGIAQYKAGQKEEARKTWGEVKSDNGAGSLARTRILISRT